ncbi:unnamed protein product [Heligmosomoides polygyrus]|uniref:Uncharacterized protein n=1 Tax=Heligmosomoides polygyrus TaxID=6339 RepID=A0A183FHW9_HELPZ|nr:unnamed protein product [Heligmosomoides polygyrus]
MTSKSSSEFDLRRKVVVVLKKSHSPATPGSPKTPNSANSFQGPPIFDSIGERPVVKRHKQLAQIGKTKSCGEIKHVERRAIKTYQEENIIKMPRYEIVGFSQHELRRDATIRIVHCKTNIKDKQLTNKCNEINTTQIKRSSRKQQ